MKIISNFHDYYDVVQAQGQDQDLVYLRKPEEVFYTEKNHYPFPRFLYRNNFYSCVLYLKQFIVGFCGKIYPVVILENSRDKNVAICHKATEVDAYVEQTFRKKAVEEYKAKIPKKRWVNNRFWDPALRQEEFQKFFDKCETKKNAFGDVFKEKRCPVFVAEYIPDKSKITYNACLKDLDFYRIFDTFTAFQEIAMFLGGLAVPLKPIPDIPDRVMIGAKGFDKYSFRKDKK